MFLSSARKRAFLVSAWEVFCAPAGAQKTCTHLHSRRRRAENSTHRLLRSPGMIKDAVSAADLTYQQTSVF